MAGFPKSECSWRGDVREEAQVCADRWAIETGEPHKVTTTGIMVDNVSVDVYNVAGNEKFDCGAGRVFDSWFNDNEAPATECARMLNLIAKSQGRSERYFYALFSDNFLIADSYIVLEEAVEVQNEIEK